MARAKSVVLTPAEKRSAVADLKKQLKTAEGSVKEIVKAAKVLDKEYDAALRGIDKQAAAADKIVIGLKAQLEKLAA